MIEPLSAAKTLVRVLSMENHTYLRARTMLRVKSRLLRHLADRSFQVSLRQREATICLQQGCGCTCHVRVSLTAGGAERLVLFKLAIRQPGRLRSDLYHLSRNINHLPEFIDSVVNALYLHLDLGLQLVHGHFRRAHLASRLPNFGFAASTVEEVVAECEAKRPEIMDEKWHATLVAIAGERSDIGDVGVLGCRQPGLCLYESLPGYFEILVLVERDPDCVQFVMEC